MDRLFSIDNKFFRAMSKLVDCFCVTILWLVFCIPVITIGASTTAFYYTVHKVIRNDKGYMWKSFWGSFKDNFKQSTIMWLIFLVLGVVFTVDAAIMKIVMDGGSKAGGLFYFFCVMLALLYIWAIFSFAYTARFEQTLKLTLKNAGLLAIANLPWTLVMLLVLAFAVFVITFTPFFLTVVPCWVMLVYNIILERIFRKVMSEEDLEAEKEDDYMLRD